MFKNKFKKAADRAVCAALGHKLDMLNRLYPADFFTSEHLPSEMNNSKPSFYCLRCNNYIRRKIW